MTNQWRCHCDIVSSFLLALFAGFACPAGTGALSFIVNGCSVATAFCPAGSTVRTPTPNGSYAVATALGLYFNATVCEAGRYAGSLPCEREVIVTVMS